MTRVRICSALAWSGAGVLVVLCMRGLVYALSPSPLAYRFEGQAGGPRLPTVALVSLGLGLALSSAIVGLAALGVRERRLLERAPLVREPSLRLRRFVVRALCLFASTSLGFSLVESYLHWRAGLGWHGVHCLMGPVHRNALPLLAALSLVAAAVGAAIEHVLAWMRRTIAALRDRRSRSLRRPEFSYPPTCEAFPARPPATPGGARAPPLVVS